MDGRKHHIKTTQLGVEVPRAVCKHYRETKKIFSSTFNFVLNRCSEVFS